MENGELLVIHPDLSITRLRVFESSKAHFLKGGRGRPE
jgi:hypothetical protein